MSCKEYFYNQTEPRSYDPEWGACLGQAVHNYHFFKELLKIMCNKDNINSDTPRIENSKQKCPSGINRLNSQEINTWRKFACRNRSVAIVKNSKIIFKTYLDWAKGGLS